MVWKILAVSVVLLLVAVLRAGRARRLSAVGDVPLAHNAQRRARALVELP